MLVAATNDSLSDDAIPALRPPRPELAPTFWEQHGVLVILFSVLAVLVLGLVLWLLLRPKPAVPVPAHVQARQALKPMYGQPEDGLLLSRISQILRRYIISAFGLAPAEMTTAEFASAVGESRRIPPELAGEVTAFLSRCDERKFSAQASPNPESAVAQALAFVNQTEAQLARERSATQ